MTPSQINIKIAEFCGIHTYDRYDNGFPLPLCKCGKSISEHVEIPNYHSSLDAIHEAEKLVGRVYWRTLLEVVEPRKNAIDMDHWQCLEKVGSATAPQRCEALLRTIGKWVD